MNDWQSELSEAVKRCGEIYVPRDRLRLEQPAREQGISIDQMALRMTDLSRGLVLKVYTDVTRADGKWSKVEQDIGAYLIEHFWNRHLTGGDLREAWQQLMGESAKLNWASLVAPFVKHPPLLASRPDVFTIAIRIANIIAKADGLVVPSETVVLGNIEQSLAAALRGNSSGNNAQSSISSAGNSSAAKPGNTASSGNAYAPYKHWGSQETAAQSPSTEADNLPTLEQSLQKLNDMIGLRGVKSQVQELTNFLQMQQQRRAAGLSADQHSLHMVFTGNPGTGKTTVARILANIFRGLNVLTRGHLIETDRSGMVASYAGQTASKTSERIEESLDGILFIDEAYSLVDSTGQDSYGREAIQVLLKRMEDQRKRLVVIMAGYSEQMDQLIKSNPGLTSRIGTTLHFPDYSATELMAIFKLQCKEHQYELSRAAAARAIRGLKWLFEHRDEHFGNGRVVRNAFELTIRRMATRIAPITPVTHELLTRIEAEDISFPDIPVEQWKVVANESLSAVMPCAACGKKIKASDEQLVSDSRCPKCKELIQLEQLQDVVWQATATGESRS